MTKRITKLIGAILLAIIFHATYSQEFIWGDGLGFEKDHPQGIAVEYDHENNFYLVFSKISTEPYDVDIRPGDAYVRTVAQAGLVIAKYSEGRELQWVKVLPTGEWSNIGFDAIEIDSKSNLYLLGDIRGSIDVDPGQSEVLIDTQNKQYGLLVKMTKDGEYIWHKTTQGGTFINSKALSVSDNRIFVSTVVNGTLGSQVVVDPGNPGKSTITIGANPDGAIISYSPDGALEWIKNFGIRVDNKPSSAEISGIATTDGSKFYVTGSFQNTLDIDPSDSELHLTSSGWHDVFVAAFSVNNSTATLDWAKSVGSIEPDKGLSCVISGTHLYVAGIFSDDVDFNPGTGEDRHKSFFNESSARYVRSAFISKYSLTGDYVWTKTVNDNEVRESGTPLVVDNDFMYLALEYKDVNKSFADHYIAKFDKQTGQQIWNGKISGNEPTTGIFSGLFGFDVRNKSGIIAGSLYLGLDLNMSSTEEKIVTTTYRDFYVSRFSTEALSTAADVLAFELPDVDGETVKITGNSVEVVVPYGTDVSGQLISFQLSAGARASVGGTEQVSGTSTLDFSSTVIFNVTSEEGRTKSYTIRATVEAASASKDLTSFTVDKSITEGTFNGTDIHVVVPIGTDVTKLKAIFSTSVKDLVVKVGDVVQVSGQTENDFTTPVVYTVFGQDGSFKDYTVTVSQGLSPGKRMYAFGFINPDSTGTISGNEIVVTLPFVWDVTSLQAKFVVSEKATVKIGNTVQVSGVTENDYTNPVTYTVVAEDGTEQNYIIRIEKVKSSLAYIENLAFTDPDIKLVSYVPAGNVWNFEVPYSKRNDIAIATFEAPPFATVKAYKEPLFGQTQPQRDEVAISGVSPALSIQEYAAQTSTPNMFLVVSEDGTKQRVYNVRMTILPNTEKDFKNFSLKGITGTATYITETEVYVYVPEAVDRRDLIAEFELSDEVVAKVDGIEQTSGETSNNFTEPVIYEIEAGDGSAKQYSVYVLPVKFDSFSLAGVEGEIGSNAIDVMVPAGTVVSALKASFAVKPGIQVKVGDVVQVSGETENDFTLPVSYTLTTINGPSATYTVSATDETLGRLEFKSFTFPDVEHEVTVKDNMIEIVVAYGTDLAKLVAHYTVPDEVEVKVGDDIQQSGITSNDFREPVEYSLTRRGVVKTYTIKVKEDFLTSAGPSRSKLVQVYPNPSSGTIMISSEYLAGQPASVQFVGVDSKSYKMVNEYRAGEVLDVSSLSAGLYNIIISSSSGVFVTKIVLVK